MWNVKFKFSFNNYRHFNDPNEDNDALSLKQIKMFTQKRNFSFYLTMKIQFTDTNDDNDAYNANDASDVSDVKDAYDPNDVNDETNWNVCSVTMADQSCNHKVHRQTAFL